MAEKEYYDPVDDESGGRKAKPHNSEELTLTLNPLQRHLIKAAAHAVGITMNEWVRLCMMEVSMEVLDSLKPEWHKDILCSPKTITEKFSVKNMPKKPWNTTDEL
jgi:hypothetical protein